jgi:hypothetical protein
MIIENNIAQKIIAFATILALPFVIRRNKIIFYRVLVLRDAQK